MDISDKLAQLVKKKPLIVIRFDEERTEHLLNTRRKFEHITIAKPHVIVSSLKLPALCLLETYNENQTSCYLGAITKKSTITTFESRLTIKKLRLITPASIGKIVEMLISKKQQTLFRKKLSVSNDVSVLSSELSATVINALAKIKSNQVAFETAFHQLVKSRDIPNINWAQEDAIHLAMKIFKIREDDIPDELILKQKVSSCLSKLGASYIYEDNFIRSDASKLQNFGIAEPDITGRAVFKRNNEQLVIYTANKLPLEKMLGIDLIYVNQTRGNIVMVQYKMLEEYSKDDWIFRPDKQLEKEISRMNIKKLENIEKDASDYRINPNPFFFKFVQRKIIGGTPPKCFHITLDHLNQILGSPSSRGIRGGIRISYNDLDGRYLRGDDLINLIRSGYIGTYCSVTKILSEVIHEVANGNRAYVLAWQSKN